MTLTFDPKGISDHLLTLNNHPMKFEECGLKGTQFIIDMIFTLKVTVNLTFDPKSYRDQVLDESNNVMKLYDVSSHWYL